MGLVARIRQVSPLQRPPGFFRRFFELTGGYWTGERKWTARLLTAALIVLTLAQVVVPVLVNLWSQWFFDALEQRSMDRFVAMVGMIGAIIVCNTVVQGAHLQVKRRLQYGWREWLTRQVIENWLWHGRHHQVTYMRGDHDNPDGRIAEDIRVTCEMALDLAHSLSYCIILLVSFTQILWAVSGAPEVTVFGVTFAVHGYLLYIAIVYAGMGSGIAALLGQPLVRAANSRQSREADFRFGLSRVRENGTEIALLHAESEERRRLWHLMVGLKDGWMRQTLALTRVTMFGSGWSVLSTAFPLLIAAPRYIFGAITLGVLMQTAQAFQQTVGALSWPVDNIGSIALWRASVQRVMGLRRSLDLLTRDETGAGRERIVVDHSEADRFLAFRNLVIAEPDGRVVVERFSAVIKPGDKVLISGDPGAAGKLFRAVARAWPWGSGLIRLPVHTRVFFMPQRPYLPRGKLLDSLCYPGPPGQAAREAVVKALERVGMKHLVRHLDDEDRWKEVLAAAEQQRLGFARLLIRQPDWIFIESATDALDPVGKEDMMRLVEKDFPGATLLTIGTRAEMEVYHDRKFVLERRGETVRMREILPELVLGEPMM